MAKTNDKNRMKEMLNRRTHPKTDEKSITSPAEEGLQLAKKIVTNEKLVKQVGTRITEYNYRRLKKFAFENDVSMSSIINKSLNEFFKKNPVDI